MARTLGKFQRSFIRPRETIFIPGLGVFMLVSAFYMPFAKPRPGESKLFLTLAFLAIAILCLTWFIRSLLGIVRLHTKGLRVQGIDIPFDEIDAVIGAVAVRERGVPRFVELPGRLVLADSREIAIASDLLEQNVLFERIHAAVAESLRPRIERDLSKGKRVRFGPIQISSEGLHFKQRTLAWNMLGSFAFELDVKPNRLNLFEFCVNPAWCSINLGELENGQLLLDLCRARAHHAGFDPGLVGPEADITLPPDRALMQPQPVAGPSSITVVYPSTHDSDYWKSLTAGHQGNPLIGLIFAPLLAVAFGLGAYSDPGSLWLWIAFFLAIAAIVGLFLLPLVRVTNVSIDSMEISWKQLDRRMRRGWKDVRRYQYSSANVRSMNSKAIINHLVRLRIHFRDGAVLNIDETFLEIDHLAQESIRACTTALLQVARAKIESGILFKCGPGDWRPLVRSVIQVSNDGIRLRGLHRWDDIVRVWLGEGSLGWEFKNSSTREVPIESIPNFGVLVELMRDKLGVRCEIGRFA